MTIWSISDLHLAFSVPNKTMDIFGKEWENHAHKIEKNWKNQVEKDDLVLIPGDISWASKLSDALKDLLWIDALPGTKLLLKGNHDYWWPSLKKLKAVLPSSISVLQNDSFLFQNVAIGGSRLWETEEFCFDDYIISKENPKQSQQKKEQKIQKELSRKIFERELLRLHSSLSQMDKSAENKIVMTHFPPIGADLKESRVSKMLEEFHIDICVFGHLHSLDKTKTLFGEKRGCRYMLVSADFLDFRLARIV